mgnify:CR=1 FL=1
MDLALVSDYSLDDYKDLGYENKWSTPKGIFNELISTDRVKKVKWYPFPEKLPNYPFVEILNDIEMKNFNPNIIFYMSCGPRDDSMFNKSIFPNSKLVVDLGDEPQTKPFNKERSKNADIVLTPDRDCFNYYKSKGYNVIHTGHWADMNIFFPDEKYEEIYDVTSSMVGNRGPTVDFVIKKMGNKFINKTGLTGEENAELYNSSKIVFQKSRFNEVTRRLFEGMATKKLVITNTLPESKRLDLFFEEDKEIVLYSNKREAVKKINYYLKNEDKRLEIAMNGYNKVKKYYTTKNIVNYIV